MAHKSVPIDARTVLVFLADKKDWDLGQYFKKRWRSRAHGVNCRVLFWVNLPPPFEILMRCTPEEPMFQLRDAHRGMLSTFLWNRTCRPIPQSRKSYHAQMSKLCEEKNRILELSARRAGSLHPLLPQWPDEYQKWLGLLSWLFVDDGRKTNCECG